MNSPITKRKKDECFDFNILLNAAVMRYDFISFQDKNNFNKSHFNRPNFKLIHNTHLLNLKYYKCEICSFRFKNSLDYINQLSLYHNIKLYPYPEKKNINKISCQICDIKLENYLELEYHVKKYHTFSDYLDPKEDNIRLCPIDSCNKFYYKISSLKYHLTKKHNKNLDLFYLFSCNFCKDRFKNGYDLRIHKRHKHPCDL